MQSKAWSKKKWEKIKQGPEMVFRGFKTWGYGGGGPSP